MKRRKTDPRKYYISLAVLIPAIFAGISAIGSILVYQLSGPGAKAGPHATVLVLIIVLTGLLTFLAGFLIMRAFLKPFLLFVEKARKAPIYAETLPEKQKKEADDLKAITGVFDHVSSILSRVESKELFPDIIGASVAMRDIFTRITKVAPTDSTVLISGESGTGKELIAESVYSLSRRQGKPFVKINCVAIPEGLLESELFGHEKGSFTGAVARKKGKFELADGGTVFLDEIGDMPLATQAKLLRVLQEKEFERVGGTEPLRVDIRLIAATNKNLQQSIREGSFRDDLYFRLNVFPIALPPLRERREDILLLARYFLDGFEREARLSPEASQLLIGFSWPGNVRELKNVLEQASVLTEDGVIEPWHLPQAFGTAEADRAGSLDERLNIMEKEAILNALNAAGGVQVKAAGLLGINQRSLWHRIKKHNIDIRAIKNLQ